MAEVLHTQLQSNRSNDKKA